MANKFVSLNHLRNKVEQKRERNLEIKKRLMEAIADVHSIDDISKLLDYKVKLNQDELQSVERLYRIQYQSLGRSFNGLTKKQGRMSIFNEDKDDIVSKFRRSGIIKFRTSTVTTVTKPGTETKSQIWDEIYKQWKSKMEKWVDNQDDRLSQDEKKIKQIKFGFTEKNKKHSELGRETLTQLNDDDTFKFIHYENGNIDAGVKNIITIDLSDSEN